MTMPRSLTLAFGACALLILAGCEQVGQLAASAGKEVAKVASEAVDTKTACTLAGQNEAFCGCLQTELGAKIEPANIEAVAKVVRDSIAAGGVQKAAESATGVDPKAKDALVKCAVHGAIGAAESEAQQ
jgi:ABC-type phosphate/phosphonate transport system substrate-binding protein